MPFNISKTAKSVAVSLAGKKKYDVETKRIAQLVGQFTGSDHAYKPGDIYITKYTDPWEKRPDLRRIHRVGYFGGCAYLAGWRCLVHKVLSTTPCTVTVRFVKAVEVYGPLWSDSKTLDARKTFKIKGVFDIYKWCPRGCEKYRDLYGDHPSTFRPNIAEQAAVQQMFNRVMKDLDTAIRVDGSRDEVQYDDATDTLVVCRKFTG
jgi:hypothetical protein